MRKPERHLAGKRPNRGSDGLHARSRSSGNPGPFVPITRFAPPTRDRGRRNAMVRRVPGRRAVREPIETGYGTVRRPSTGR